MKKQFFLKCLLLVLFFTGAHSGGGLYAFTIDGPAVACVASVHTYSASPAAIGSFYYWTVTPGPAATVVTPSPANPATIHWLTAGTRTITATEKDASGSIISVEILVVTVYPFPAPYITTNMRAACATFDSTADTSNPEYHLPPDYFLDDAGGCSKVCEGSYVEYRAHTMSLSAGSWNWTILGGTIVSGTSTSSTIIVKWGVPGAGNITLTETNAGGCVGTSSVCIDIIAKPISKFTILPHTMPVVYFSTCVGASVVFHDLSTAPGSSIVYHWWDFGDGSVSPLPNPTHVFTAAGTYTVSLVVKNSCGCVDTSETEVEVLSDPGPDIQCPSVVCEGESASYNTSVAGCTTYTWVVTGGTTTAGGGTSDTYVDVTWGTGDASGYGYISLSVSGCPGSVCPGTTTIKIPIIQVNPAITGPPNPICTNRPVQYGLPIWPGTRYQWGVIGNPGAVISGRDNNIVTLQFATAGTYTVHAWWQNTLKFCGGDQKFTVVVEDPPSIIGADPAYCVGAAFSFSLTPTTVGDWTMSGPSGVSTYLGTSFISGTVPAVPGLYTISVSGTGFCPPAPVTITVVAALPPPDEIDGDDEVCFGQPYTYTATAAMPGGIFEWFVLPGSAATLSTTFGNEVIAIWSGSGTIYVRRLTTAEPHCAGNAISMAVIELPVPVNVTGNTTPCANQSYNYSHGYVDPESSTTWTINPPTVGSVMAGIYSETNTILWNDVPSLTTATITATVMKCGVAHVSTMEVTVNPGSTVDITTTLTAAVCSSEPVEFTATCGASTYTWNFGDGTDPEVVSGGVSTVSHTFSVTHTSTATVTYTVCVTTGGGSGCPCLTVGTACIPIDVIPGPYAVISHVGNVMPCTGTSLAVTLNATVTNSVPTDYYQWYKDGSPIGGATGVSFIPSLPGVYTFIVTDATGCSYTSNEIVIMFVDCIPDPGCVAPMSLLCAVGPCGVLTCTLTATGTPAITTVGWFVTPGYTSMTPTGTGPYILTVEYPHPIVATVHAFALFDNGCTNDVSQTHDVPLISHFTTSWNCATDPYELTLHATPELLPGYTATHAWIVTGTGGGTPTSSDPVFGGLSTGSHDITYTATVGTVTCTVTANVVVPDVTDIDFVTSPAPLPYDMCVGLPVTFTPVVTAGTVGYYYWNFGDGAKLLANPGTRNFTWQGPGTDFNSHIVTLSGHNSIGCAYTATNTVTVWKNKLQAEVTSPDNVLCFPPVTLNAGTITPGYGPAYTYTWTPTPPVSFSSTDYVSITGAYFVTMEDPKLCRSVSNPPINAMIINTTPPVISGATRYCYGDVIKLNGYAGAGYSYQWYRNGVAILGATSATLAQAGLPPATYTYRVSITFTSPLGATCTAFSANYPVTMYALPPTPTLTGPVVVSCPTYELELTASSPISSPTYVWSSGSPGYGATNTVNSGGAYRCWLTDLNGCTSHADIVVPAGPETFRDWFPAGCYTYCSNILGGGGIRLFGPPGFFELWDWMMDGSSMSAGGPGLIDPITISSAGYYALKIDNGLCDATFDTMTVTETECQCQTVIDSVKIECDTAYGHPHGYIVKVWITNPYGSALPATIGTMDGPMMPSSFSMSAGGSTLYTFAFTVITLPPPYGTTIWLHYVIDGRDCYDSYIIQELPPCSWTDEKPAQPAVTKAGAQHTGMMLHPNPAQNIVNVTYTYAGGDAARSMKVYDALGRLVAEAQVLSASGTIAIPLGKASPGIYLVKMEENGRALHVQRLVVGR